MSVIELDLVEVGELCKLIVVIHLVPPNDIVEGSRAEEVLLLKSQLLSGIGAVVRVKDTGDVLGVLSFSDSPVMIARVEFGEIKAVVTSRFPKSQVVCVICVESRNWSVISHSFHFLAVAPVTFLSGPTLVVGHSSVKSDIVHHILSLDLPWVALS